MLVTRRRNASGEWTREIEGQRAHRTVGTGRQTSGRARERVGTALKARIEKLITIKTSSGCGCENLATQMDGWGIAGCEKRREEIVSHLVGNRGVLVEALRTHGTLGHAAGLAIEFVPEIMLRAGAGWLLDQAIADVKSIHHVTKCREPIRGLQPRPFTGKPRLTMLCHCWPNGDNWRRHVDYLQPVSDVFTRKIMGVATGKGTSRFDDVRQAFGDSWEYFEINNDPKLREVATYRPMLERANSVDDNDVTFCIHTKGAQDRTAASHQVKWWTEAMYETVVYNWQNVLAEMGRGYSIAGSFRRFGGHFRTRYGWHFTGTFYAFRNAATFAGGIPEIENRWWGTESWPGNHFTQEESACMFGDNAGDLYKSNPQLELALAEWRRLNAT